MESERGILPARSLTLSLVMERDESASARRSEDRKRFQGLSYAGVILADFRISAAVSGAFVKTVKASPARRPIS
jgi:hypothetical protein